MRLHGASRLAICTCWRTGLHMRQMLLIYIPDRRVPRTSLLAMVWPPMRAQRIGRGTSACMHGVPDAHGMYPT